MIHADGIAETTATIQVKASVDTLDADVKAGFATAVNALITIAKIEIEAVKLLFHLTIQTQLQTSIRDDTDALRDIAESAYPQAALERQRLAGLRAEIERCCPPEKPKPACTYEPCLTLKPVGMPELPQIGERATEIRIAAATDGSTLLLKESIKSQVDTPFEAQRGRLPEPGYTPSERHAYATTYAAMLPIKT